MFLFSLAKRVRSATIAAISAGLFSVAAPSRAEVLWRGDFETGNLSQWDKTQMVHPDRLQVVTSPVAQGRYALKATVRQGDNPIVGASGNRNELVYDSKEPAGTERFYRWQTKFPSDYPYADYNQLFAQFHHTGNDGAPPVLFGVRKNELSFMVDGMRLWTESLVRDKWHDFILHVKWSPYAQVGFVELRYNEKVVVPRKYMRTQFPGMTQFLKMGLYRNENIAQTGVVYHDGVVAGTTLEDVLSEGPEGDGAYLSPSDQYTLGGSTSQFPEAGCSTAGGSLNAALAVLSLGYLGRRRKK